MQVFVVGDSLNESHKISTEMENLYAKHIVLNVGPIPKIVSSWKLMHYFSTEILQLSMSVIQVQFPAAILIVFPCTPRTF